MSAHDSVIPESPPILENLQDGRPGPEERGTSARAEGSVPASWCLTHSRGAYRAKSEAKPPSACLQDGSLRELSHALSLSRSAPSTRPSKRKVVSEALVPEPTAPGPSCDSVVCILHLSAEPKSPSSLNPILRRRLPRPDRARRRSRNRMSTLAGHPPGRASQRLLAEKKRRRGLLSQDLPEAAPCLPLQRLLLPLPDDGLRALPPRLRRAPERGPLQGREPSTISDAIYQQHI